MDWLKNYKLIESEDGGYDLIIYLEKGSLDTEFAEELGKTGENQEEFKQTLLQKIFSVFPDKKINTVKIMLGTALILSFVPGLAAPARAIETAATQSAYQYNINLTINGKAVTFNSKPLTYNNLAYIPISEFGKAIGATVWWNDLSKTVGINQSGTMIAFVRGSGIARVNGVRKTMPVSFSIGGTTYAPLRFIAENLGYNVSTNSTTKTVDVSKTTKYTVVAGDSLSKIANQFSVTVTALKSANGLTGDVIQPGQVLIIPKGSIGTQTPSTMKWPSVTYIVKAGDTVSGIAKKFGVSATNILKYNYMTADQWIDAGDKIAISGYAPRQYTVTPGKETAPTRKGVPVDWVFEGQYLIKRNYTFTIVDVDTGKRFRGKMIAGYNHIDMETLTSTDTATMKSLFGTWKWAPRAVVIYINGMNLAASLSGMPHSVDTVSGNGVTGHFDLYMKNSTSHSSTTSTAYIQQHQDMVKKASR